MAIGEESVIADAHEAFGQHVKKETAKKLHGIESTGALPVTMFIILPPEADGSMLKRDKALIGNGHAVGVACQVLEDLLGPSKRWLGVDDPVSFPKQAEESLPGVGLGERL